MWPLCLNALSACAAVAMFLYVARGETLSEYTCCKTVPLDQNWTRCPIGFYEKTRIDTYHLYTAPRVFLALIWTAAAWTPYTHAVYNTHILVDRHDRGSSVYGLFMSIICILYIMATVFTLGSIDILSTTYCYTDAWHNALTLFADVGVWAINLFPVCIACLFMVVQLILFVFNPRKIASSVYAFYFPHPVRPPIAQPRSPRAYTPPLE